MLTSEEIAEKIAETELKIEELSGAITSFAENDPNAKAHDAERRRLERLRGMFAAANRREAEESARTAEATLAPKRQKAKEAIAAASFDVVFKPVIDRIVDAAAELHRAAKELPGYVDAFNAASTKAEAACREAAMTFSPSVVVTGDAGRANIRELLGRRIAAAVGEPLGREAREAMPPLFAREG